MKLGVLGGTFNPIHLAHLRLGEEAREILSLDRLLFVPAGDPPLKSSRVAPGQHRLAMVERAIARNPGFESSDLEVRRAGPSYTVDTLEALSKSNQGAELWFIVGGDTLPDLEAWRDPARLFELANFAVATRPGFFESPMELMPRSLALQFRPDFDGSEGGGWLHRSGTRLRAIEFTKLEISATDIRRRIAAGESIRYLLPDEVIDYVEKHGLYRN